MIDHSFKQSFELNHRLQLTRSLDNSTLPFNKSVAATFGLATQEGKEEILSSMKEFWRGEVLVTKRFFDDAK